jgi:branched-chain amino acid transport system permease protein
MTQFLEYAVSGIPTGCVFALMAIGIVLTYQTSGVLNLAFGAQAFVSAATFFLLRSESGRNWPMVPAFIVSVVIVAPALGWFLDVVLYRHLRTAPPVAKLVTSLGLLVAIPAIVKLDFLLGSTAKQNPPGVATAEVLVRVSDIALSGNELATIGLTLVSLLGLTLMFRFTNLGLQMRAVVESPRMSELSGVNADRVGSFSWMLSSFFAGLAGVLIAPIFANVNEISFFNLLIAALAAAALGRLVSLPLAFVGGIGLGMLNNLMSGYLPPGNVVSTGLRQALPFGLLFLLLLLWPGLRGGREVTDPMSGVDPPPPAPSMIERTRALTVTSRFVGVVVVVGLLAFALLTFDKYWMSLAIQGVILAIIFLSIIVVTGFGGQISLCQASFAGIGFFGTAQIIKASGGSMSVLVAIVLAAAIAAVAGGIVALPALRLGGIYLALATLAFAVMFETVLAPLDGVGGGLKVKVPRPVIAGIDFGADKNFFLLCVVLLAILGGAVLLIRGGTTGRFLDATRTSETAATSIGINPGRVKVMAFIISAAIAGFGGGLMAMTQTTVSPSAFQANLSFVIGLVWLVLVITAGSRNIQGAIFSGLAFALFAPFLERIVHLPSSFASTLATVMFGLGAITYSRHPEGIIEANSQRFMAWLSRRFFYHEPEPPPSASGGTTPRPSPNATDAPTTPVPAGEAAS